MMYVVVGLGTGYRCFIYYCNSLGVDASNSGHYCSDIVRSTTAIKNLGVLCIKQFGTQFVVAVSRWLCINIFAA